MMACREVAVDIVLNMIIHEVENTPIIGSRYALWLSSVDLKINLSV